MVAPLLIPAIGLIADLVPQLMKYFGGERHQEVVESVTKIVKQVAGVDNVFEAERIIRADPNKALELKQMLLKHEIELEALSIKRLEVITADIQDARVYRDERIFYLGLAVLIVFAVVMGLTLIGLYNVLTGESKFDPSVLAVVSGIAGAVVGYVANNATQVISYFFGSSQGSKDRGDDMSNELKNLRNVALNKVNEE